MGNIIKILLRIFPFLFFIFLEIIALFILFKNNEYYNAGFVNRSNYIVGNLYDNISITKSYFGLRGVNDSLASENAKLLQELFNKSNTHSFNNNDSLMAMAQKNNYVLTEAKVVSNTISNSRNYLIINKGSLQGIEVDMGVMGPKGPVGVVIQVSKNYACVMSFLNKDANISARVRSTKQIGVLKWQGPDIRVASLEDIPKHVKLKKGEIIETSGFSTFYPEGIVIGTVRNQIEDNESNFAEINVLLHTDFSKLEYVYVIKNNQYKELKEMERYVDTAMQTTKQE
jgi:rod shape-determining protein MreC